MGWEQKEQMKEGWEKRKKENWEERKNLLREKFKWKIFPAVCLLFV